MKKSNCETSVEIVGKRRREGVKKDSVGGYEKEACKEKRRGRVEGE